jgi:hypothetical protein
VYDRTPFTNCHHFSARLPIPQLRVHLAVLKTRTNGGHQHPGRMWQNALAHSGQLLFDSRDALSEEGSVLLAVTRWRGRAARTTDVPEALSVRSAEVQQGKPSLDQLADHLLRDLPTRQPKATIRSNGSAKEDTIIRIAVNSAQEASRALRQGAAHSFRPGLLLSARRQ